MSESAADLLQTYLAHRDVPCPRCGYNLRGHAGGLCPECGVRLVLTVERGDGLRVGRWLLLAAALSTMGLLAICLQALWSGAARVIADGADALFGSVRWRPWAMWSVQEVTNCFLVLFWVAAEMALVLMLVVWAMASEPKAVERARSRLARMLLGIVAAQGALIALLAVFVPSLW